MHDLTTGSIPRHILRMAAPIAIGMFFQTAYYLVDLYFVAQLGDTALAGVGAAGNVQFIVMALTQVLGVGTMVLIAHAAGRKDEADGNLVFNQSLVLAALAGVATLGLGLLAARPYLALIAADAATAEEGVRYLHWFVPAMALQFALVSIGSALRGTGVAKPTMLVQLASVVVNALLAPVLIAGWGTGRPMGVAGAGLASTISVGAAVLLLLWYFATSSSFVRFQLTLCRPQLAVWARLLRIGVPAGAEFALMFLTMAVTYWIVRDFGAAAQAGYGVGSRVLQAVLMPGMAVAFAAAPIAAQNVAAGHADRARQTFLDAVRIGSGLMLLLTLVCRWRPEALVHTFASDAAVVTVAAEFLAVISLNFISAGLVFTCSGMFQALGNTVPTVISSAVRLCLFLVPALWLARQPGFALHELWLVSVGASTVHAGFAIWLLHREVTARRLFDVLPSVTSPTPADAIV